MAKSDGYSYFRRSSLFWMVTVTISLSFYTWTVFWPQDVPYGSLGPLGALAKHLVDNHYPVLYYGWFLTWAIHLFEALFALKICSCLDSHSDGTHSLQRIHWRDSDGMTHFYKSETHLHLG
ncbi:transmembrane protein 254 isoform X3 [Labeo rohita]|uniref:transmembrane protein 254 isoform X3 n=1 Tax=Labeo rohita TaxID=84645 RepID=UPI0021E2CDC8|nr:transmembrane protein 254 isoform X3 [Labeo rohita]